MRKFSKKALAFFLGVSMILGSLVFAPKTAYADTTGGDYSYRITITTTNDCKGWNNNSLNLTYNKNNGAGASTSVNIFTNNYNYFNTQGTFYFTNTINGFPTGLTFNYSWGGGATWRKLVTTFTLEVMQANGSYSKLFEKSFEKQSSAFSAASGTETYSVPTNLYPKVTDFSFVSGATSLTVPKSGSASVTSSYQCKTLDQYGVEWWKSPTYTLSSTPAGIGIANGILSVSSAANTSSAPYYRNITVKATCGDKTISRVCTIYNASYSVSFRNESGSIISSGTYYHYQMPTAPDFPKKSPDDTNHYVGEWSPAVSGVTADTVYKPVYTSQPHSYEGSVLVEPTCLKTGVKQFSCSTCSYVGYTETTPALGHSYSQQVIAPTCTEQGYTIYTCTRCGLNYTDDYTDSLGHNYASVVTPPTKMEQGYTTYTCSRCGDSYVSDYTEPTGAAAIEVECLNSGLNIYGNTVSFLYTVTNIKPLSGYSFKFSFDENVLEYRGFSFLHGISGEVSVEGGVGTVICNGALEPQDMVDNLTLNFVVKGSARPGAYELGCYDALFNYESSSETLSGEVCTYNIGVEKTALQNAISETKNVDLTPYTSKSIQKFNSVITAAQVVYDDSTASYDECKANVDALKSAKILLVLKATDKTALFESIQRAQSYIDEKPENYFTDESVSAATEQLLFAQQVYDSDDVSDEDVSNAIAIADNCLNYLEVRKFTVSFYNFDNSLIYSEEVSYGENATPPSDPERPSDKIYYYVFSGWYGDYNNVTSDRNVMSVYVAKFVEYKVKFVNHDGSVVSERTYHYNDPLIIPENPVREADKTYTYEFVSWDKEIVPTVTEDMTYVALYDATFINYTITFKDYNGVLISQKTDYHYGDVIELPETPVREADNTYTYEFAGWSPEVTTVKGDTLFNAIYTPKYIDYTVKFVNYDNSPISEKTYHYGDAVELPETPVREADNTYTYEFAGWDKEVSAVTGDVTYKATFNPVYIDYTVKFVNFDDSFISEKTYHYGDAVEIPETPVKSADNTYTYEFAGWDKEVSAEVFESVVYKATFNPVYIDYTVKFVNFDDSLISEKTYHYGDTVEVPETPVKAADNTYTYEFAGWDSEVTPVAGSVTYKATFNPVYIDYTVKFVNYDDSLISEKTYHYGDTVELPDTPTKPGDDDYLYVFSGWTPEVTTVTGSVVYTAEFTPVDNSADYTAVDLAQQAANELESGMYTTVSYARVTKALSEVVRGLKVWEQERVDAMAQAINDAIDALVSTTEYDAILATCLAVNNDTNAYTTASYEKFTQAMAKIDVSKDFNTETATQADVDAAAQELSQAYALLEANHMEIVGADEQLTIGESKAFVIGVNTNIDTTKLKAEDGGANVAYLKYLDAKGNVITNSKKSLSTGCTVQLMFGGEVIESYVIVVYGDINGDGQVTVSDIMKAKAMKNSTEGFSEYQIEAAKCGTESINVEMVTELAKRV